MDVDETLAIHEQLWTDPCPEFVVHRGTRYPIEVRDNDHQFFRRVYIEDNQIITQNMRKNSQWTRWVERMPDAQLTWILRPPGQSGYKGRVSFWTDPQTGQKKGEVIKFGNPDERLWEL